MEHGPYWRVGIVEAQAKLAHATRTSARLGSASRVTARGGSSAHRRIERRKLDPVSLPDRHACGRGRRRLFIKPSLRLHDVAEALAATCASAVGAACRR